MRCLIDKKGSVSSYGRRRRPRYEGLRSGVTESGIYKGSFGTVSL